MTHEYILKAAIQSMVTGHHEPHCFSAHVPGHGYISQGLGPVENRADYLRQLEQRAKSELDNLQWSQAYAEPGYTDPDKCILFADWNCFPRGLDSILEKAGYAIEWSDEWSNCGDCGKAVRTSPDSYSYQPHYVILNECELVCLDCVDWPAYLESIEDDPHACCVAECNPAEHGYTRLSDKHEYENGFHPGQTDDPAKILKALQDTGRSGIVFRLSETSQFYVRFETWQRDTDETDE